MKKAQVIPNTNMISQTLLDELRKIVKEDYGVTLKSQDLSDFACTLLGFFETLLKIESKKGGENYVLSKKKDNDDQAEPRTSF